VLTSSRSAASRAVIVLRDIDTLHLRSRNNTVIHLEEGSDRRVGSAADGLEDSNAEFRRLRGGLTCAVGAMHTSCPAQTFLSDQQMDTRIDNIVRI